ncbi:MAG: Gldg family protein, partial [Cellvibrionaceae bacterium]|nr:Gldg family protein [Cellvibrionaceae bacterium]
ANLDWGPVISGYIATVTLGAAYIAIGLYVSSRSDNQIVSLILTCLLCGIFYFLGSKVLLNLFSNEIGEILRALGSGSRFESITRGVLDLRDLVYYLSIVIIFLGLNRYGLEKDRWAKDGDGQHHRRWQLATALIIFNAAAINFWLAPLSNLRIDTTKGEIYSISDATRNYLDQLQEPLLIRGYFSEKTHPLLAPLVPQLRDLVQEYQAENRNKIRVEIIDPAKDPEAEEEAGSKYGIKPVPFRVADRYQSAVVNSYFNLLIQYGDEYKVLGFQELIDVKASGESDIDVKLSNPEYDITNAVKQILYAYQSGGNLFDNISKNLSFTAYISSDQRLPPSLAEFTPVLKKVLQQTQRDSANKFGYEVIDPDSNQGQVAQEIADMYGFQPMASSLFDTNTFYYYLVLNDQEIAVQIPIPEDLSEESFKRGLDSALKRFASGFTKSVGILAPEANPYAAQMGQPAGAQFNSLQQVLNENMTSKMADLSTGRVADDIDLLMVLAPENLDDKALFAIDQFLMKGGTVIAATSPVKVTFDQRGLSAAEQKSNLEDWLAHHGMRIENTLVMDTLSSAFPAPITRQVGMFSVQEMTMLDYPFFVEARDKQLNQDNAITSGLPDLTVPWASPLVIDSEKNQGRQVIELVSSSENAWLDEQLDISPKLKPDGSAAYTPQSPAGRQLLAAAITGKFSSYFSGKQNPLLREEEQPAAETDDAEAMDQEEPGEVISSLVEHSPESARLIVVSSNSFAEDRVLSILGSVNGSSYVNPVQMLVNAAEWSLEDEGLLSIRSRNYFNRTLPPLQDEQRTFWEILNYALALIGVLIVYIFVLIRKKARLARYQGLLFSAAQ